MTIQDFLNSTHRELTKYDHMINTDAFGATERFNDLWNNTQIEMTDEYTLPALHLWETGFCQGDASEEEIENLITEINNDCGENLEDENDLFYFLDQQFLLKINSHAENMINDYEREFKEEYKEAKSQQFN